MRASEAKNRGSLRNPYPRYSVSDIRAKRPDVLTTRHYCDELQGCKFEGVRDESAKVRDERCVHNAAVLTAHLLHPSPLRTASRTVASLRTAYQFNCGYQSNPLSRSAPWTLLISLLACREYGAMVAGTSCLVMCCLHGFHIRPPSPTRPARLSRQKRSHTPQATVRQPAATFVPDVDGSTIASCGWPLSGSVSSGVRSYLTHDDAYTWNSARATRAPGYTNSVNGRRILQALLFLLPYVKSAVDRLPRL